MKKTFIYRFTLVLLSILSTSFIFVSAQNVQNQEQSDDFIQSKLLKVSFFKQTNKTDEQQIYDILNSVAKNMTKRKLNKLKQFYDSSFVTNDGFNYNFYFEILNGIWQDYPKLEYTIVPVKINFSKNYAEVLCNESINGTVSKNAFWDGEGIIESKAQTIYYLKKSSINWYITGINVINETGIIKFGNATNMDFQIQAPFQVQNDSYYTISLDVKKPLNSIVVASLNSMPIVYPQKNPLDIFKITTSENTLERMVKANKNGFNENAIATIGIYERNNMDSSSQNHNNLSKINENKVNSTGAAFVLRRVNVININKNNKLNE